MKSQQRKLCNFKRTESQNVFSAEPPAENLIIVEPFLEKEPVDLTIFSHDDIIQARSTPGHSVLRDQTFAQNPLTSIAEIQLDQVSQLQRALILY